MSRKISSRHWNPDLRLRPPSWSWFQKEKRSIQAPLISLRNYGAKDYKTKVLQDFLRKEGISHEVTARYCPQSNSLAWLTWLQDRSCGVRSGFFLRSSDLSRIGPGKSFLSSALTRALGTLPWFTFAVIFGFHLERITSRCFFLRHTLDSVVKSAQLCHLLALFVHGIQWIKHIDQVAMIGEECEYIWEEQKMIVSIMVKDSFSITPQRSCVLVKVSLRKATGSCFCPGIGWSNWSGWVWVIIAP